MSNPTELRRYNIGTNGLSFYDPEGVWVAYEDVEAAARRAQPEGEAPQADLKQIASLLYNALNDAYQASMFDGEELKRVVRAMSAYNRYRSSPAATLSPLCGAQHAESGAAALPVYAETDDGMRIVEPGTHVNEYHHADDVRAALAAQQAAAPGNTPEFGGIKTSAHGTSEGSLDFLFSSGELEARRDLEARAVSAINRLKRAAQLDGGQEGAQ